MINDTKKTLLFALACDERNADKAEAILEETCVSGGPDATSFPYYMSAKGISSLDDIRFAWNIVEAFQNRQD